MTPAAIFAAVALLLAAGPTLAAEPQGCDAFAWNIAHEQQLLQGDAPAAPATAMARSATEAISVALAPLADAGLALPPKHPPKSSSSFAGMVAFAPGAAGNYRIGISAVAWIDVVQGGKYLEPIKFTGAEDCPGIRKSVEFAIGAEAFTVQLSRVDSREIRMVLTPSD